MKAGFSCITHHFGHIFGQVAWCTTIKSGAGMAPGGADGGQWLMTTVCCDLSPDHDPLRPQLFFGVGRE